MFFHPYKFSAINELVGCDSPDDPSFALDTDDRTRGSSPPKITTIDELIGVLVFDEEMEPEVVFFFWIHLLNHHEAAIARARPNNHATNSTRL